MPFSFKPTTTGEVPQPTPVVQATNPVTSTPVPPSTSAPMSFSSREGEEKGMVEIILIAIFSLSIIVVISLFAYHFYLSYKVESGKTQLASYEGKLGTLPLEDMRKLSNRLKVVSQFVKSHPSVNTAFRILEDSVENPVTYKRFDLHYSETLKVYELQLSATAPNYRSIIEQIDTLKRKPYTNYISNVSVGDVHPDETGSITFTLKMPIGIAGVLPDSLVLKAENAVDNSIVNNNTVSTTTTTTTSTSTATSSLDVKP